MTNLLIKLGIIQHSIQTLKQGGSTILANVFRRKKFLFFGPPVNKIEKIGDFDNEQKFRILPF
jgi:hypothetical protein